MCSVALMASQVHPTDLGHWKIAEFYKSYLPSLIAGDTPQLTLAHRAKAAAAAAAATRLTGESKLVPTKGNSTEVVCGARLFGRDVCV
jgi:hypothetical protein